MSKQSFLRHLDKDWQFLLESIDGLSDDQLLEPNVVGIWSIRDVLNHITTWENEALKYLPLVLEGKRVPRYAQVYGGIDAFNTLEQDKKRKFSLSRIQNELQATHRHLCDYLSNVPEENFVSGKRFQHRLGADTYLHYRAHAEQIKLWRTQKSL